MATHALPTRTVSNPADFDDAVEEDSSEVTKLFHERLQALKHACGYFEEYITATEKVHSGLSKDYDKTVLKTVTHPLREAHHFDANPGGIAGLFDNMRANTQALSNSHAETAKALKGSVLPVFERLHAEIKSKTKELTKGAGKGAKLVDKARNTTQKQIETLGAQCASFDSSAGTNVKATDDPYVLQRGVYHRLNKQVIEENNNRDDMISVQNNFSTFEAHVIQTIQQGLQQFHQVLDTQASTDQRLYGDMLGNAQRIPPDFEWNGFIKRNTHLLIDPSAPKRSVENIAFPHQDHRATQPELAGSLERRSKMLKRWETGFWVITKSKYLHEFKSDDDFAKDPTPENSLYLPDCLIGAVDGTKFNVKGKNASGGLAKLSMSHEYQFKAHTPADAKKWHDVIATVTGSTTNDLPGNEDDDSTPVSPVGASSVQSGGTTTTATTGTASTAPTSVAAPGTATTTTGATAQTAAEKEAAHAAHTA